MADRFKLFKQILSQGVTSDMCLFCPGNLDTHIVRGATREHSFNLPFEPGLPVDLRISYVQDGRLILEKKLSDVKLAHLTDNIIYYTLSETETLKFDSDRPAYVQLKASFKDHGVITTKVVQVDVIDSIDDRYISNESLTYAIEATINNTSVDLRDYFGTVSCSNNVYKCKFLFDSTWNKYLKKAIFKDEYNHKIYSNITQKGDKFECVIPSILLNKPGKLYVGVTGFFNDGENEFKKPTIWSNSIRIKKGCVEDISVYETAAFDTGGLYIYCGISDDAYSLTIPKELEILPTTRKELLKGYTWNGYNLTNQYNVIAIPKHLGIECVNLHQNGYDMPPTYHSDEDENYIFYYFSSKATGEFTSIYTFKEVV